MRKVDEKKITGERKNIYIPYHTHHNDKITIKNLAQRLNKIEYSKEIPPYLSYLAKRNNFLIIYGDDEGLYFHGKKQHKIEIIIPNKLTFFINNKGKLYLTFKKRFHKITVKYGKVKKWRYELDLPHKRFDIYQEKEYISQGIIIDLNHL